jgi:hypothetical protein
LPSTFPISQRVRRLAGLLEREDNYIDAKYYSAVIFFEEGPIALLTQSNVARMDEAPDDTVDLPSQFIDCKEDVTGSLVTNAFILHVPGERVSGRNGPQLFLVLDRERMLGLVPTQRGSVLHVEPIISSPLFRHYTTLTTLEDKPITMEELMGL